MIRWLCPYCGRKLKAPESAVGRSGKCPTCRNRITVPPFSSAEAGSESGGRPGEAKSVLQEQEQAVASDEALHEFFQKVASAQTGVTSPPQRDRAAEPEAEAGELPTGSTEVKVATIEATVEFSQAAEEPEVADEAVVELPRPDRLAGLPSPARVWRRRQHRILGVGMVVAGSITVLVEVGLVETARILAARAGETTGDMLAFGLWGLLLFAVGVVVILLGYTIPWLFWIPQDAMQRRESVGSATMLVVLGSIVGASVYLANRRLLEGEVREGGPGWNFCRYLAALWCGFLVYSAAIVFLLLVWSFLRGLPLVSLLLALLSTYLPQLFFWPLVCLALLGYLLRVNSVVEIGSEGGGA